jgi:hypothetical protein
VLFAIAGHIESQYNFCAFKKIAVPIILLMTSLVV